MVTIQVREFYAITGFSPLECTVDVRKNGALRVISTRTEVLDDVNLHLTKYTRMEQLNIAKCAIQFGFTTVELHKKWPNMDSRLVYTLMSDGVVHEIEDC